MGKQGAAGGKVGNGVVFLCAFAKGDPAIEDGVEWLGTIQGEVGLADAAAREAVKLEEIKPRATNWKNLEAQLKWQDLSAQILRLGKEVTRVGSKLKAAQLADPLGGLPEGYTLVLFGHGTGSDSEDDGGMTLEEAKDAGGNSIEGSKEVLVFKHLEAMKLEGDAIAFAGSTTIDEAEVRHRIPIVQALRDSEFNQIYLAACGNSSPGQTNSRLKKFADRLAELTGRLIYYNTEPFFIETFKAVEFINGESGPVQPTDSFVHGVVSKGKQKPKVTENGLVTVQMLEPAQGTAYVGGASVELTTKPEDPFVFITEGGDGFVEPSTWLPGSSARATPP